MQLYEEKNQVFEEAINEWYNKRDFKEWINKWGDCNDSKYNIILGEQVNWCLKNEIMSTPTTIINGKLFPESYSPKDIENFIFPIFEFERSLLINKTQP